VLIMISYILFQYSNYFLCFILSYFLYSLLDYYLFGFDFSYTVISFLDKFPMQG
jgi:hypothetical protein